MLLQDNLTRESYPLQYQEPDDSTNIFVLLGGRFEIFLGVSRPVGDKNLYGIKKHSDVRNGRTRRTFGEEGGSFSRSINLTTFLKDHGNTESGSGGDNPEQRSSSGFVLSQYIEFSENWVEALLEGLIHNLSTHQHSQ